MSCLEVFFWREHDGKDYIVPEVLINEFERLIFDMEVAANHDTDWDDQSDMWKEFECKFSKYNKELI